MGDFNPIRNEALTSGPKLPLDIFAPASATELKQIGATALIIDEKIAVEKPPGMMMIELARAGTVTPKGPTPPFTVFIDPTRYELQSVRFDPKTDLKQQLASYEEQGWQDGLRGTSSFIDMEHVGADGLVTGLLLRKIRSKSTPVQIQEPIKSI